MNISEGRSRVVAKVKELDEAFERARILNAELQTLGAELRREPATASAFWTGLLWRELGDVDRPQAACRLSDWRAAARRNGWL